MWLPARAALHSLGTMLRGCRAVISLHSDNYATRTAIKTSVGTIFRIVRGSPNRFNSQFISGLRPIRPLRPFLFPSWGCESQPHDGMSMVLSNIHRVSSRKTSRSSGALLSALIVEVVPADAVRICVVRRADVSVVLFGVTILRCDVSSVPIPVQEVVRVAVVIVQSRVTRPRL